MNEEGICQNSWQNCQGRHGIVAKKARPLVELGSREKPEAGPYKSKLRLQFSLFALFWTGGLGAASSTCSQSWPRWHHNSSWMAYRKLLVLLFHVQSCIPKSACKPVCLFPNIHGIILIALWCWHLDVNDECSVANVSDDQYLGFVGVPKPPVSTLGQLLSSVQPWVR